MMTTFGKKICHAMLSEVGERETKVKAHWGVNVTKKKDQGHWKQAIEKGEENAALLSTSSYWGTGGQVYFSFKFLGLKFEMETLGGL